MFKAFYLRKWISKEIGNTGKFYEEDSCKFCFNQEEQKCKQCGCMNCGGKTPVEKLLFCERCQFYIHFGCLPNPIESLNELPGKALDIRMADKSYSFNVLSALHASLVAIILLNKHNFHHFWTHPHYKQNLT